MNEKQWVYLHETMKKYCNKHSGKIPGNDAATDIMQVYTKVMDITKKSREQDPVLDEQVSNYFGIWFHIIHSLEKEGKVL